MASVPIALAPYVSAVFGYDADLGEPGVPGVHRGLPSTGLTLVVALDEPLDCGWDDATRGRRWVTVSGLHSRPARIHHDGHQRGVQLALTTSGALALLGVSAGALGGEILDLDEVVGAGDGLASLSERVAGLDPDAATEVVLRQLARALARRGDRAPQAQVGHALSSLTRGARVQQVAEEVGYSRRRLSTLVRAESGLTPKQYQRVARFDSSRRLVGHRPLAELAAVCGYADQGHLTRDWSALAGCPPSVWLREEFPFLQDATATPGAV